MTEQNATGPVRIRKRPIEIEAMQFDGSYDSGLAIKRWVNGLAADKDTCELHSVPFADAKRWFLLIATLEGQMRADAGWWVARGVEGEFYPIKPSVVDATYDLDPESDPSLERRIRDAIDDSPVDSIVTKNEAAELTAHLVRSLGPTLLEDEDGAPLPEWAQRLVPWAEGHTDELDFDGAEVPDRVQRMLRALLGLGKPGSQVPLGDTNFDQVVEQVRLVLERFLLGRAQNLFHGVNALSASTQALVLSRVADLLAGSGAIWNDHTERLELLEREDDDE